MNPETGVFDGKFYPEEGLQTVHDAFRVASGISVSSACLAVVGSIWKEKADWFSIITVLLLIVAGLEAWWGYSTFFYAVE